MSESDKLALMFLLFWSAIATGLFAIGLWRAVFKPWGESINKRERDIVLRRNAIESKD